MQPVFPFVYFRVRTVSSWHFFVCSLQISYHWTCQWHAHCSDHLLDDLVDKKAEYGVVSKFESDRNVVEWLSGDDKLIAIDSLLLLLLLLLLLFVTSCWLQIVRYARSGDETILELHKCFAFTYFSNYMHKVCIFKTSINFFFFKLLNYYYYHFYQLSLIHKN